MNAWGTREERIHHRQNLCIISGSFSTRLISSLFLRWRIHPPQIYQDLVCNLPMSFSVKFSTSHRSFYFYVIVNGMWVVALSIIYIVIIYIISDKLSTQRIPIKFASCILLSVVITVPSSRKSFSPQTMKSNGLANSVHLVNRSF